MKPRARRGQLDRFMRENAAWPRPESWPQPSQYFAYLYELAKEKGIPTTPRSVEQSWYRIKLLKKVPPPKIAVKPPSPPPAPGITVSGLMAEILRLKADRAKIDAALGATKKRLLEAIDKAVTV